MKKLLLSLTAIMAGGFLFAQTVTCPNLTITNTSGQSMDLYTELGKGKAVVLDLFFTTCGWCQTYAPIIDQAYKAKGSGAGKIDFWGIDVQSETNASINAYKTQFGVSNQCFGNAAAGSAFSKLAQAFAPGQSNFGMPLYAVICPNKKGFWDVNYPPTAGGFDIFLSQCGVLGVNNLERDETQARFINIYPNPANNDSKLDFFVAEQGKVQIAIFNLLGEQVDIIANETFDSGTHTLDFSAVALTSGNYLIKMTTENGIADVTKLTIAN